MALNNNIIVPMPKRGVVKRRMGDKIYVYYATATYRNEKGQPTCDRVSIGNLMSKRVCLYHTEAITKYIKKICSYYIRSA